MSEAEASGHTLDFRFQIEENEGVLERVGQGEGDSGLPGQEYVLSQISNHQANCGNNFPVVSYVWKTSGRNGPSVIDNSINVTCYTTSVLDRDDRD